MHLKGNALDGLSPAQARHLQPRSAPFYTAGRELLIQRSSHHAFDHLIAGDRMDRAVGDIAPIAQNGHPIGDGEHLFQPVADVEDPHSLTPQFPHEDEELLYLMGSQRGCGFVHDEDPGLVNQGFGNFDQLLLSGAEPAAGLIQVHFDSHPSEEGRHLLPFAAAGHEASGSHFLAQENVLHRR